MDLHERSEIAALAREVSVWVRQAKGILAARESSPQAADAAVAALRRNVVEVPDGDRPGWRVLALRTADVRLVNEIARAHGHSSLTPGVEAVLTQLAGEVDSHVQATGAVTGLRRVHTTGRAREQAAAAGRFLRRYRDWAVSTHLPGLLTRLRAGAGTEVALDQVLAPGVGVVQRLTGLGSDPVVVRPPPGLAQAPALLESAAHRSDRLRAAALAAANRVRAEPARLILATVPVASLAEVSREPLRLQRLAEAGIVTVGQVLDRVDDLERIEGVGPASASRILAAARTVRRHTVDELATRLDPRERTEEATELLHRLAAWQAARSLSTRDLALAAALTPVADAVQRGAGHLVVWGAGTPSLRFAGRLGRVVELATPLALHPHTDPWQDHQARPAHYATLLDELGAAGVDRARTHGDLPEEIVRAVRAAELDTRLLIATLRGYQDFAARFALVQRKVVIGDEMGLGKTLEALAVLAHLAARGGGKALVVCPASVLTNWMREVADKSTLTAHRLHGEHREQALQAWRKAAQGAVAITTYAMLGWLARAGVPPLGCVVVDEAHHIKNPDAQRSLRCRELIGDADRAMLLTGTPMENRIEEFKVLVGYLRPDLVVQAGEVPARTFRRQVAPAYLRRNQEDVLTELPELVQVQEWVPLSRADEAAYRAAVEEGDFAVMRQAAMLQGRRSAKLDRLAQIVTEAGENGRKVLVFSYFRAVLDQVMAVLPGAVFGPLTGSVPAPRRQAMVDAFSAAEHGASLVAQVEAGGVGLNIQAASVVVICEPQFKPTAEWQAIARARRMGQLDSVQVHRLLSEEGVDVRVTELLARKSLLFDDFARISETARAAPEAYDVSEAEVARQIIAAERRRLERSAGPDPG